MTACRHRPLATAPRAAALVPEASDEERAPLLPMENYLKLDDGQWLEEFIERVEMQSTASPTSRAELDYSSVNVYLLVMQQTAGIAAMSVVSTLAPLGMRDEAVSPLRTLVITGILGAVVLARPVLAHLPVALLALHRVLRWSGALWLLALTGETLAFSACASQAHTLTPSRVAALAVCVLLLLLSAVARLVRPVARSDGMVAVAVVALLGLAVVPQTLHAGDGPLGHALPLVGAAVRCARGAAFALVYGAVVVAATPAKVETVQTTALVLRGLAGAAWVLAVSPPLVLLAPVYVAALVYRRVAVHVEAPDTSPPPSAKARRALQEEDLEASSSSSEVRLADTCMHPRKTHTHASCYLVRKPTPSRTRTRGEPSCSKCSALPTQRRGLMPSR